MTDHQNTEADLLATLDRRAAAAVTALDRAVDGSPIPDFDEPGGTHRLRRRVLPPIAIAAGLLVVALVAAVLVFAGGDEQSTVAGQVDFTRLVLPDPEAADLRIEVAFDTSRGSTDAPAFASGPVTVQGDDGAPDPWTTAVVSYTLPADVTTLDGDPVDIGGPEAFVDDSGPGVSVGWAQGDVVRYLVSTHLTQDELVAVATDAAGTPPDGTGAIPGQSVLFTGTLEDVFPSLFTSIGRGGTPSSAHPVAGVFYGPLGGSGERGLAVATSAGSASALRATNVLATDRHDVSVRGHDAVAGTFFGDDETGLLHVSWLEDDNTLVRVDAIGMDEAELLRLLDGLESIDAAAFAQLVDAHPVDDGGDDEVTETVEEVGDQILAEVSTDDADGTYRAVLTRSEAGDLTVEASGEGPSGGAATATTLASLDSPVAVRHELDDGRTVVAGVVGPSGDGFVDLSFPNQDVFDDSIIGPSTATIEGSDHVLFLAVVPAGLDPDGGSAIATAPDGSIVTLPL